MTEYEVKEGLKQLRVHHFQQGLKTQKNYVKFIEMCEKDPSKRNKYHAAHAGRMLGFHLRQVQLLDQFFDSPVEKDL